MSAISTDTCIAAAEINITFNLRMKNPCRHLEPWSKDEL